METIVMHEQVHRQERHSIDTLFLELLTMVFWFNPAMWLLLWPVPLP
jgi:beta-lactamase regulating signal transducer with metallopeptidase domain